MEQKVAELLKIIKQHNKSYRNGKPEVTDAVYDREVEMLRELDPDNSWFHRLEPAEVRARRKSTLPIPMKSLNKVKDIADFKGWLRNAGVNNSDEIVIMPKFDGLSLLCNEETGEAWSRGGSENEGQDCTKHLKAACARHSNYWPFTYGEFVFSVKGWETTFSGRINPETGTKYKSPRNTAAGLLNRDEPSDDLRYVEFYRYGTDPDTVGLYEKFDDLLADLCESFSQKKLYKVCRADDVKEEMFNELFKEWRKEYYIDGLVIYVNKLKRWESLGRAKTSGNPNYAIAYKSPDFTDAFDTRVKGIDWKVSKSGALKPVVSIDTVDTGDCQMDSPTGYNAKWIKDMKIAKGARVLVTRSGGVIPKILETIKPASFNEIAALWNEMDNCPHCGAPTAWSGTGVELCCTNPMCPGIRLAKIVFFYLTCGAENIGEETLSRLFNAGYNSINAMLNITFNQLLEIEGFGEGMANVIIDNNKMIRAGIPLPTLMHASDQFPGIGAIKAQQILDGLDGKVEDALYNGEPVSELLPPEEEIANMPVTLQNFWNNLTKFQRFVELNGLVIRRATVVTVDKNGKYKDMAVCFSGVRNPELETAIIKGGGKVASGVSKKTTHLVVKDKNANSAKILKSKELGIPILTMDEFLSF